MRKNLPKPKPSHPHLPSAHSKARLVTETSCLQLIGKDPACMQMFAVHGRETLGVGGCRDETSAVLLQAELTLHRLPLGYPTAFAQGAGPKDAVRGVMLRTEGWSCTQPTHTLWLCCC